MGRNDVRRTADGVPLDDEHPKCGAKKGSKRAGSEGFCQQPAGFGTDHLGVGPCRYHMGATPSVSAKYKAVKTEVEASRTLARLDVEPVDNPLLELAKIAAQAVAWKDQMAQKVNDLLELRFTDEKYAEQLRSEVVLWERALDRCEKVLVSMAKLDIDERLAQIDERQAETITKALLATLNELEVPAEVKREARKSIGRHLRAV